jgi:hypothetical protein
MVMRVGWKMHTNLTANAFLRLHPESECPACGEPRIVRKVNRMVVWKSSITKGMLI